jgi:hypothetical protein
MPEIDALDDGLVGINWSDFLAVRQNDSITESAWAIVSGGGAVHADAILDGVRTATYYTGPTAGVVLLRNTVTTTAGAEYTSLLRLTVTPRVV